MSSDITISKNDKMSIEDEKDILIDSEELNPTKIKISDSELNRKGNGSHIPNKKTTNLNNLILSCVNNEEYCYTMLDYLKKMCHFSQIDYYIGYTQLIYCFRPKEM
jgi:hypothetical protein